MALQAVARALGAGGGGGGLCSCTAASSDLSDGRPSSAVRLAEPVDRASVVETVVLAFDASPEMNFFFRPREQFEEMVPIFAGRLFDKRVGKQRVWIGGEGATGACALWDFSPCDDEHDATFAPTSSGFPADARERMKLYDDLVHDMLPHDGQPMAYLGILACRPDDRAT